MRRGGGRGVKTSSGMIKNPTIFFKSNLLLIDKMYVYSNNDKINNPNPIKKINNPNSQN